MTCKVDDLRTLVQEVFKSEVDKRILEFHQIESQEIYGDEKNEVEIPPKIKKQLLILQFRNAFHEIIKERKRWTNLANLFRQLRAVINASVERTSEILGLSIQEYTCLEANNLSIEQIDISTTVKFMDVLNLKFSMLTQLLERKDAIPLSPENELSQVTLKGTILDQAKPLPPSKISDTYFADLYHYLEQEDYDHLLENEQ